ncbi:MAG: hypothetical protein R6V32_06220 [Bacteroidales bacterium]
MKILTILVFILLLSACIFSPYEYVDMDDSNRPNLENGDTLLFTDSEGEVDTLVLFIRNDYDHYDDDYHEFMNLKYNIICNGILDSLIFYVQLNIAINGAKIGSDGHYFDKLADKAIAYEQFGQIYFDVIEFEMPESYEYGGEIHAIDSPFENLWYSKKHGIVRYDMKDGESYKLVE